MQIASSCMHVLQALHCHIEGGTEPLLPIISELTICVHGAKQLSVSCTHIYLAI